MSYNSNNKTSEDLAIVLSDISSPKEMRSFLVDL